MGPLTIEDLGVPVADIVFGKRAIRARSLARGPGVFIGAVDDRATDVSVDDTVIFSPDLHHIIDATLYVISVSLRGRGNRYLVAVASVKNDVVVFSPCAEGFSDINASDPRMVIVGRVLAVNKTI